MTTFKYMFPELEEVLTKKVLLKELGLEWR